MFRSVCLNKKLFSTNIIQHKIINTGIDGFSITKNKDIDTDPYLYKSNEKITLENLKSKYDVIIIGAGHNGLVCANYLAKYKKSVLLLEKRHLVGGLAVTEELLEGYKFSRCSYVLSLFRKKIIDELFGDDFFKKIKLIKRNPKGMTPTKEVGKYLVRRNERDDLKREISKFSINDANKIDEFDDFLNSMVQIVDPLLDMPPPGGKMSFMDSNLIQFVKHVFKHRKNLFEFYHFITSSAEYYLNKYFESDILKATFATDAVIGAMKSPKSTGSAYVLLHHVMGSLDKDGNWFYVEGGMGSVSKYLADKAVENGVTIALNTPVEKLIVNQSTKSIDGAIILNGIEIKADTIITNCDPYQTYFKLMTEEDRKSVLSSDNIKSLDSIDYTSPVMKINLAVSKLPEFKCLSEVLTNKYEGKVEKLALDYLTGTMHMNCENMGIIDAGYVEALEGKCSTKPIIEMTIPSVLDRTLVPKNSEHHVVGLFCQYAPNKLKDGEWNEERKREFANKIYSEIEEYCPGFTKSIIFEDILSPWDLENQFSNRGGNIFHGAMDLSSIFFCRPFLGYSSYKHPIKNLWSCSASMHPGGGVMGAPGRNCALEILKVLKH